MLQQTQHNYTTFDLSKKHTKVVTYKREFIEIFRNMKLLEKYTQVQHINTSALRFLPWLSTKCYQHLLWSTGLLAVWHPHCLLSAGCLAKNPPTATAVVDRWDRQTDGQTDPAPQAYTMTAN